MSRKPLEVLKTGVSQLKAQIKACKDELLSKLSNREQILSNDKTWLDNEANLVDEDTVINLLENTSDYECGLEQLEPRQKTVVDRLMELGGVKKAIGNKRKCS
jgi:hypothetical protein